MENPTQPLVEQSPWAQATWQFLQAFSQGTGCFPPMLPERSMMSPLVGQLLRQGCSIAALTPRSQRLPFLRGQFADPGAVGLSATSARLLSAASRPVPRLPWEDAGANAPEGSRGSRDLPVSREGAHGQGQRERAFVGARRWGGLKGRCDFTVSRQIQFVPQRKGSNYSWRSRLSFAP